MNKRAQISEGFTLVELLVVISVIALLATLIFSGVSYAHFRSRVTGCTNNYKQITLSANMYASDDPNERLPSFELPTQTTQLIRFQNLYPWLLALPMLSEMDKHGVSSPKQWFCPLQPKLSKALESNFQIVKGRTMTSIADLTTGFEEIQGSRYASVGLFWWVPRKLQGSDSLTYPEVSLLKTRESNPWPSRLSDTSVSSRPIVTDKMVGEKAISGDGFLSAHGGHTFRGKIRNSNSGYADGHVETRKAESLKWELQFTDEFSNYAFY